jgi:hypothetical protein
MKKSVYALTHAVATAIAAVFLLTLAGCDLTTGPEPGQSSDQKGKAAVSLAIAGTGARTVAPANAELGDIKTWKLLGAKNGETQELLLESEDPTGQTLYLETGDWDFTLKGYNEMSLLILEGTLTKQTISLDGSNTLSFTVAPVSAGTGTVAITIKLPEGHGITQAKVFKDSEELGPSITPNENKVVYKASHTAGNYYFSFWLFRGDALYGAVSELVKVRRNLTSEKAYTLTAADLNLRYAITFHKNGGEFDGLPPILTGAPTPPLSCPCPLARAIPSTAGMTATALATPR